LFQSNKTVHIVGLEGIQMTNVGILEQVLQTAEKARSCAPTHANANSSRSHQVLQLMLKEGDNIYGANLFLSFSFFIAVSCWFFFFLHSVKFDFIIL
jgi:hypothetical protein